MQTLSPPRAIDAPPPERQPIYRDAQLHVLMKTLRAAVRPHPPSRIALDKAEQRLRFVLRVVEQWDASHAARARELIALGCLPAANGAATMIFDRDLRHSLLCRCYIGADAGAVERMEEALELGREVL
jgi:hypothetical protein